MRSFHYHAYQYHARLDLENFAFVAQPRATGLKQILRSYHYYVDHYNAGLDLGNFASVALPRAAGLEKLIVRNTTTRIITTRTATTRGWT